MKGSTNVNWERVSICERKILFVHERHKSEHNNLNHAEVSCHCLLFWYNFGKKRA